MIPEMVSGYGQHHTNEADAKFRRPYVSVTMTDIREIVDNPPSVDKTKGRWVIPSTLPCRRFKTQEQQGQYWMLWADLDKNTLTLDKVSSILDGIIGGADFEVYTSRSANSVLLKARILVPLGAVLNGADWISCQEVLNDQLMAAGIEPDRASEGSAQLCYLPNRGKVYKSVSRRDGSLFNPLQHWQQKIAQKREAIVRAEAEARANMEAARQRREQRKLNGYRSPIEAFNAAYSVEEILLSNKYDQRGSTFRHPGSESGSYSASVKHERVYSLSRNDPLYTANASNGAHDAFSAWCVLEHGGDQARAVRAAVEDLGLNEVGPDEFDNLANPELVEQAEISIDTLFNDVTLVKEDVDKMAEAEFLIPNLIVRGHVAAYVAPANGGKTTIFVYVCEELCAMGMKVIYINADASPGDLKRHYAHAVKHGYRVIAPDAKAGKSTMDVMSKLAAIAAMEGTCNNYVFIVDTLKKIVDVINKREAKAFYKLLRRLTVKGATVCLLGHVNKYVGEDGKTIFEGTGDLRNDLDELIYFDVFKNEASNCLEITTRPDKVRAEFSPKSYTIHLGDERRVTEPENIIKILPREEREVLGAIKGAIAEGCHSQKEILAHVKENTAHGEKKIRDVLHRHREGSNPEINVQRTGRGKDLHYTLPLHDEFEDLS